MKVRILGNAAVKHDGRYLEKFEVYDLPDQTAEELIKMKDAEAVDPTKPASPLPEEAPRTPKFDKSKGYVAEASIDPDKKAQLERDHGKEKVEEILKDETPVTGVDPTQPKDNTPEPTEKTEVVGEDGKPLSDEELKQREAAARAGKPEGEAGKATVSELQNSGNPVN